MGFFRVAFPQTEAAFEELELDLQLKYKAQYWYSISTGLIFEKTLKVSVNRRLAAALEEGDGKTPSWLQWEEEQTLNGIKERRKQLHTEMASVQRWVHISRKYTCGLTKIHEGSKKQPLSWRIQNSKQEISDWEGRKVWGQDTGLGLWTSRMVSWYIKDQDAHGEAGMRPPNTTHRQTNQLGHQAGYLLPWWLQTPVHGSASKDKEEE